MSITFKEILAFHKKEACMRMFLKSYLGHVEEVPEAVFGPSSKFFCAYDGDTEVGFIRITNYTDEGYAPNGFSLWSASDAHVRQQHRGQGILKNMLQYVIDNHSVQMLLIKQATFYANKSYYESMDFCNTRRSFEDPDLIWVIQKHVPPFIPEPRKTLVPTSRHFTLLGRAIKSAA
jgi:hypothetical protein